jgi:hypothetical protein
VTPGVFSICASGGLLDPRRRSHPNGGWKLGFFTNTWVWLGSGAMLLAQLGVVGRRLWRGGPRVRAGQGQEVFQRIA